MTAITITGLHKAFRDTAVLRGLDLEIERGSLAAILGPSGSGKTTLLRVIAGLDRADRGQVSLAGEVVDNGRHFVRPERRRVGYVPQEASLFPHLTVEQNVGFGITRPARRGARVSGLLEMVGLGGLGGRYPHELSGGQQQRVALARALAIDPQLLLLDEPFSALDPSLRASVREEVRGILAATGITTLLVTHDQEEALSVADQVAVLRDGRVAQFGTPQQLYSDPIDVEMARFLGDANLVDGTVAGPMVQTPLGALMVRPSSRWAVPLSGAAVVLVRPEQIAISSAFGAGAPGRVLHSEFHGHDSVIEVASETPLLRGVIRVRIQGSAKLEPDARVTLSASGEAQAWPMPSA
ncbi:MAG TPA: ABC transporter ATP-binding protein [Candidatus Dormibacteraeota bacterium]|nr:ABC transporter ATP-binding protein [Candidatus Dormibacteraeota bacterium]